MTQEIFSRYELKYVISMETYQALAEAIAPRMRYDRYGDELGRYNIVSLYFDSSDHQVYYETRNRLRFRQKLRLRIYDEVSLADRAFLEIKQKFKNVVNKRRTAINLGAAYHYLGEQALEDQVSEEQGLAVDFEDWGVSNPQILKEIDAFKHLYNLQPRTIVSYDRQAFQGIAEQEEDLRVTFDYNVLGREENLRIEAGPQGLYLLDPDLVILEVKVSNSVPFWLSRLLSDLQCQRQSFSKYCSSIEVTSAPEEQVSSS